MTDPRHLQLPLFLPPSQPCKDTLFSPSMNLRLYAMILPGRSFRRVHCIINTLFWLRDEMRQAAAIAFQHLTRAIAQCATHHDVSHLGISLGYNRTQDILDGQNRKATLYKTVTIDIFIPTLDGSASNCPALAHPSWYAGSNPGPLPGDTPQVRFH